MRPLEDVRIIAVEQYGAGPFAASIWPISVPTC